jgi:hypothetical protein
VALYVRRLRCVATAAAETAHIIGRIVDELARVCRPPVGTGLSLSMIKKGAATYRWNPTQSLPSPRRQM